MESEPPRAVGLGIGDEEAGAGGPLPRVLGVPAFRNRHLNPYNALLYEAVRGVGVAVDEITPWRLVRPRYDIVHLHWPEYLFSTRGRAVAALRAIVFMIVLSGLRRRRTRIVWTVHNLAAHEGAHTWLEQRMWRWFVKRVDGYIALSEAGRDAAVARFPALSRLPGAVIAHGHYRDAYPDAIDRPTARRLLGVPPDALVTCFFGAIRPYKNVPSLIRAFGEIDGPAWRLVIAGHIADESLRTVIAAGALDEPRIHLNAGYVPPGDVQRYLRAADLMVLPYGDIVQSGSAILALSFGVPVLVPMIGSLPEVQRQVGADWVRTYHGCLTGATIEEAMRWATQQPRPARPDLDDLDWDRIAGRTVMTYQAILGADRRDLTETANPRRPRPGGRTSFPRTVRSTPDDRRQGP